MPCLGSARITTGDPAAATLPYPAGPKHTTNHTPAACLVSLLPVGHQRRWVQGSKPLVQQRADQPDLDRVGDGGGGGLLRAVLGHGHLLRHGRRILGGRFFPRSNLLNSAVQLQATSLQIT